MIQYLVYSISVVFVVADIFVFYFQAMKNVHLTIAKQELGYRQIDRQIDRSIDRDRDRDRDRYSYRQIDRQIDR